MIRCADNPTETIAIVLSGFTFCGSQRDVILLGNALAGRGIPITMLALRHDGPLRSLVHPAVRVIEIPGRQVRYALPGLRRALRELAPRLVLSSEATLNACCVAAVRSLPPAHRPKLVLREVESPSLAQKFAPTLKSRLAYYLLRRIYRYADRIVTLTEGARHDLIENFSVPAGKISAMRSNAVITPDVVDRVADWDGEQGRESDLIVSLGRLSPEKNQILLLRAMTLLKPDRRWRLAFVGDGPERSALEAFARDHDLAQQTAFVGFDADPFSWLMRAKLVVCSSVYEGLCNAIIEALGCGTPVVSTDCPYGPREILQNGRYGTLVPVGDAVALASAIETAFDCPVDRANLIDRALNYTSERAADSFLEILADL